MLFYYSEAALYFDFVSRFKKSRTYVYEGLYRVKEASRAPSQGPSKASGAEGEFATPGFLVCKFHMEGIPGECQASAVVNFKQFYIKPVKRGLVGIKT